MRPRFLRMIPAAIAALFLLSTVVPGGLAFRDPFDEEQTITGPGSMDYKYATCGEGISIVKPGAPATTLCPLTPIVVSALGNPGFAAFDLSHYNGGPFGPQPHLVRVWVEHVGGLAPPDPTYGFSVTVCADRDDDGVCTNQDPNPGTPPHPLHPDYDDQFKTQYSNPPALGEPCKEYAYQEPEERQPPDGETKNEDPGKDSKDCGDPTDAEVWMCVLPDEEQGGLDFDDLWVFVSDWVDEPLNPNAKENTGTGISTGEYGVFVQYFPTFEGEPGCEVWD